MRIYGELSQHSPDVYMPDIAITLSNMGILYAEIGYPDEALAYYKESLRIYREFFKRYPSAYAPDYLAALDGAMEVYKKLRMEERMKECEREIEQVTEAIDRSDET